MSRHLGTLNRVHKKLISALGEDHALVLQLKKEIEEREMQAAKVVRLSFVRSSADQIDRSVNQRWQKLCRKAA